MQRLSVRDRQRQVREDAILDATFALMLRHGYVDMSMDEVAAEVGISKATLYQHFGSKEELAVAAVVREIRAVEDEARRFDPGAPAVARLERLIRLVVGKRFDAERRVASPLGSALAPVIVRHRAFRTQYARMFSLVCGMIEQAQREGDVPASLPPRVATEAVLTLLRFFDYERAAADAQLSLEVFADAIVAVVFRGITGARS
jgi:TetR/AcrR family transcriptional regulator, regulator of autoinduction and epiphytic fitness